MRMSQHLAARTLHVSAASYSLLCQQLGRYYALILLRLENMLQSDLVVSRHGSVLLQNLLNNVSIGDGLSLGVLPAIFHPSSTPHSRAVNGNQADGSDLVLQAVVTQPDQLVRLQESHESSPVVGMLVSRQRLGLVVGMFNTCKQTSASRRNRRCLVVTTGSRHIDNHPAGVSV